MFGRRAFEMTCDTDLLRWTSCEHASAPAPKPAAKGAAGNGLTLRAAVPVIDG